MITFVRAVDSWNTTLVTGSYELYEDKDVEVLIEGLNLSSLSLAHTCTLLLHHDHWLLLVGRLLHTLPLDNLLLGFGLLYVFDLFCVWMAKRRFFLATAVYWSNATLG